MDVDRRTFMAAVGGAVAVTNVIGSEACRNGDNVSAVGLQRIGSSTIEPGALLHRANLDGEFLEAARYWDARLRLEIGDRHYDVLVQKGKIADYYEEAGQGIPMVLQHTAGSDGRQWRHLLEDTDIQKRFRMIAYDLPFHGKSVPPIGVRWWEKEYRLTADLVMDSIIAISRALKLERPVYMGCSIGGYLAPDLALYHPDDFRADGDQRRFAFRDERRLFTFSTVSHADSRQAPHQVRARYVRVSCRGNQP